MSPEMRLAGSAGLLIDRQAPLSFSFEGQSYQALAGDTIASALAANDVSVLSRSFKYHRPRGILSNAGHDANCLVQVGDEPNVPADRRLVTEGMAVTGQNYRGTLARDRDTALGRLGRFMPPGFYYRSFFRPRGVWDRFWEPRIRRKAGLGRINPLATHTPTDKQFLFCDVAIVGGGPAGMSAALAAAQCGAEVLLIDENSYWGGSLAYRRFDADRTIGLARHRELMESIQQQSFVTVLEGATCTGWFSDNWLSVLGPRRLYKVRARQVVFATGSIEQPLVFCNNDLPGIMYGGAAPRLIRLYGVRPGRRAVILAGHDDAYGVALDLAEAGVEICAVIDLRQDTAATALAAGAMERGIPIRQGYRVEHAKANGSGTRVSELVVDGEAFACDLVCMCGGRIPAYQLAAQSGAKVGYDTHRHMLTVNSTRPGVHLAGFLRGSENLDLTLEDGGRAGLTAAGHPELENEVAATAMTATGSPQLAWPIYPHPSGKEFVDFDEDLQVGDIVETVREGYAHIELTKRFSTVGMGPSQGRQSAVNTARLVAQETGREITEVGVTTARPPVLGEPLELLAGRGFQPERLTPLHSRHTELGAQMLAVGAWWRPLYYGPRGEMDRAAAAEVDAVRQKVGIIDVTTLGKFEIRGPDAATLLERLYTFNFAKQPVGRIRYLLMTNEAGTIVDDGVAARLSENHFYITATTGAGESTLRQILWWNAQWRLKVDITNVTGGVAAINLAGPRAREVLQSLSSELDLSRDALPYLHVCEGLLDGIPARLLRIGFVGELGYEIHVPASYGAAVWDRLLTVGTPFGLRPVGIEAQRRLRLEKGHIIIGQDTDGLTTPGAAGMEWAVGKSKPFFVGSRSLQARSKHPVEHRLVGFVLPVGSRVPPESCLVIEDGRMAGVVTSATRSSACRAVIGLALVEPRLSNLDREITIRLPDGTDAVATIAKVPFYDPEGERQQL
jgi:sarcosine oxidase, subunit alpha